MDRIMIFGGSGSGKSTLARQVGEITGLPVIHMDKFFFRPGWEPRSTAEIVGDITAAAQGPRWVFEGNNTKSMAARVTRADLIVFLDMPRMLRMRRAFWRVLRYYGRTRPDMAEGCPERYDHDFLFGWVWNFDHTHRPRYLMLLADWRARGKRIVHLRSRRQVRRFLADLRAGRYEARHD